MRYSSIFALLFVMWLVPLGLLASDSGVSGVTKVRVVGNERIDSDTIEFYAKVSLKDGVVGRSKIDEMIKNLYSTALFSKVEVEAVEDELVISVVENPVVRSVTIVGNKAFSNKNLENDILKLKKTSVFTEAKMERDMETLRSLYHSRGLLGAEVSYAVKEAPRNSVDVIIKIVEGLAARIARIVFVGNDTFSADRLREVLASKERKLTDIFGFFGGSTKFFAERLMVDRSLLRDFYTSRGYLDFKIRSVTSEVSTNLSQVTLVFSLEEGKKYSFGESSVEVDGKAITKDSEVYKLTNMMLTTKGSVFDMAAVNKSVAIMSAYLQEKGNLFAAVSSEYDVQGDFVNVKYVVTLGKRVYVRKVNIMGNDRTLDLVIRRKLGISEGDVYSTFSVRQSRKRLLNLDFFEAVEADTHKVSDSLIDLNFKVKEHGTGSFDVGAGFSPASGLVGKISIKERNIFGTGKVVGFEVSRSVGGMSSVLDMVTQDIFESDISFGVGAFYNRQGGSASVKSKNFGGLLPVDTPFSSTNAGFSSRLSCALTDSVSASLQYNYKYHSIHNISDASSVYIREQEGDYFDSSIGYSIIYSDLDNIYKPTRGVFVRLMQSVSGMGGNLHYVRTEGSSSYIYPVFGSMLKDVVLKIRPSFGYVFAYAGEKVKIGQRFFAGSEEVRGFSSTGIGPRDSGTQEALGGKLYYALTAQLDFPVGLPENLGIRGSLFWDMANLFGLDHKGISGYKTSNTPRMSVGFGFSWKSPFGPVRIDFGFPIVAEEFDVKDTIRISTDTGI